MLRRFLALCLLFPFWAAAPAMAQDEDSVFADYGTYSTYVDTMLTSRQWSEFIKHMGGRDEYTEEQLTKIGGDFDRLYPNAFTSRAVFRETDLGGGMKQEARAYWGGGRYLYYYAILHDTGSTLVVLNFSMNSKIEAIMQKF